MTLSMTCHLVNNARPTCGQNYELHFFFMFSVFLIFSPLFLYLGFPVGQSVKDLPAMQETAVRSPGQEDPLENEMATHSSVLAWRIPWTEEPGGLQSCGR